MTAPGWMLPFVPKSGELRKSIGCRSSLGCALLDGMTMKRFPLLESVQRWKKRGLFEHQQLTVVREYVVSVGVPGAVSGNL